MANAIRRVSCQVGHDPRSFAMLVYGGNGPVHAGKQAEELGIRRILIPRTSPAFSALGLLLADHVVEGQRAYIAPSRSVDSDWVNSVFDELAEQASSAFERAGVPRSDLRAERYLAMCYPGQTFEMSVPIADDASPRRLVQADIERTIDALHRMHEEVHGFAARDEEPVVRAVRLSMQGRTEKPRLPKLPPATSQVRAALTGNRPVYFDGGWVDTPVYDGERVGPGHRLEGPAIVEERFTTVVLYPGHKAELDALGNFVVTL